MRMVGLFGMTTVVARFVLVLWKIPHNRGSAWLIQRQLWALALAIYLYVLTPVDLILHTYNVRQILAGDIAPSVQIAVHPSSAEGYLVLAPLTRCEAPRLRRESHFRQMGRSARIATEDRAAVSVILGIPRRKEKHEP